MAETTLQHLYYLPVSMISIPLNLRAHASSPIERRSRSGNGALLAIQNP